MKLFFRELVGKGQPLIILHGLFGSSDNWLTQAKMLASHYHIYIPDQRNHGQSPHSDDFNYDLLADDIHEFILANTISDPIILGHSMGGKAAMKFALAHPELVNRLIIVDMAPKAYPVHHDKILEGMKALPVKDLVSRNEADELLSKYVAEPDVRQFLLKNLQRNTEGGFSWKLNLPSLDDNIGGIGEGLDPSKIFDKPALFIRGSKSSYVEDRDIPMIKGMFPKAEIVTMNTGHWVQAEKPQEFVNEVMNYLNH